MIEIGEDEKSFILELLKNKKRIEKRSFDEARPITTETISLAKSDGAIKIARGKTEIIITIKYIENCHTLSKLNITNDITNKSSLLFSHISGEIIFNGNFFLPIEKMVTEMLKKYDVGMEIELYVVNDDGNVYGLFFEGLAIIFKDLRLPNISDLKGNDFKDSFVLPKCISFAVWDGCYVIDPTKKEELSCNSLLHYFVLDGKIIGVYTEKCNGLDPFLVQELRNSIIK